MSPDRAAKLASILVTAEKHLRQVAAPKASRIAEDIQSALDALFESADDVLSYYSAWPRGGEWADNLDLAGLAEAADQSTLSAEH